jgi:hypothetical protein
MGRCKQCGNEYESKRSTSEYCSPACKQVFYRNRIRTPVTVTPSKDVTATDIFKKVDWSKLTKAEQVKRWAKIKAAGAVLTGGYELTDYEREHYKPAHELAKLSKEEGKAIFNPVSVPGDTVGVAKGLAPTGLGGGGVGG